MSEYTYVVSKDKPNEKSYIVCLLAVPDFPFDRNHCRENVHLPLKAVIGAARRFADEGTDGAWAFVTFTGDEKQIIGDQLSDLGAKDGEWFYCTQYIKEAKDD